MFAVANRDDDTLNQRGPGSGGTIAAGCHAHQSGDGGGDFQGMDLHQGQFLLERFTNDHRHIIGGAVGPEDGQDDAQLAELLVIGNGGLFNAADVAGIDEVAEQGLLRRLAQVRQRHMAVVVAKIEIDIVAAGPLAAVSPGG